MNEIEVDLARLRFPAWRPAADADKLARHGKFDWQQFTPITVEQDGSTLEVVDGVTRVENARNSGIKKLPAYVFPRRYAE